MSCKAALQRLYRKKRYTNNLELNWMELSAAHSIWPGSFHRSLLLLFTFHHRQTLAWLCLSSTMCSAATLANTLTLPLSSQGTLTKPNSDRSCRTFTNMYPVQLEDRIHWIIATLSKMPTMPTHYQLLANRNMPPFSSHWNINKGSFRISQWRELWRAGPPTQKLCYRWLLMTCTGTCSGPVYLMSVSSQM